MKRTVLFFCICLVGAELSAQDKPKSMVDELKARGFKEATVTISKSKLDTRLEQIQKAWNERREKVIADDPECNRLEFLYRGLLMAKN